MFNTEKAIEDVVTNVYESIYNWMKFTYDNGMQFEEFLELFMKFKDERLESINERRSINADREDGNA